MATKQPNILILWGDDVGYWNISRNNDGMMGYQTPNIDRVAHEGVKLTDWYGQQSCTAGRAAFITGQNPLRTGLTKVGMPAPLSDFNRKILPSPNCSSRSATPLVSLERTISAIEMNFCRPSTDSTSSSAISIT